MGGAEKSGVTQSGGRCLPALLCQDIKISWLLLTGIEQSGSLRYSVERSDSSHLPPGPGYRLRSAPTWSAASAGWVRAPGPGTTETGVGCFRLPGGGKWVRRRYPGPRWGGGAPARTFHWLRCVEIGVMSKRDFYPFSFEKAGNPPSLVTLIRDTCTRHGWMPCSMPGRCSRKPEYCKSVSIFSMTWARLHFRTREICGTRNGSIGDCSCPPG